MSDEAKARLEVAALFLSIVIGLAAAVKAWAILPYRLDQVESKATESEHKLYGIERESAKVYSDIRESLAEIRAAQGQFRQDIAEIKSDVKSLKR